MSTPGDVLGSLWIDSAAVYANVASSSSLGQMYSFDRTAGTILGSVAGYTGNISTVGPSVLAVYTASGAPCNCPWTMYGWPLPGLGPKQSLYTGNSPGLVSSSESPLAIVSQGTTLIFTTNKNNLLVGSTDGSAAIRTQESGTAGSLVVADSNGVVWSESNGTLASAPYLPYASGSVTRLGAPAGATPAYLVLDASSVYWINSADGSIYRSPRDGSAYTVMASPVSTSQLAVDGTRVYWAQSTAGTINAVSKTVTGITTPTIVQSGQTSPSGIAVDPGTTGAIYWDVPVEPAGTPYTSFYSNVVRLAK
jgi:hypothetical protein